MTIVETEQGAVEVAVEPNGVLVARGVPYAAPPVGELRWRAPEPVAPWAGVRPATFGPIAPQLAGGSGLSLGDPQPQDEDCLYLNVWTPAVDGRARPVMVWIHGGAFQSGSGSADLYNGANLAASGDVVVVTLNYRLGILGWLASDALAGGNWGLLDQIAALRWVRGNIEAFGGDAGNVTIFGESAGSISVSTLLGTPAARGLFHKAIAQSGGPGGVPMRAAERFVAALLEATGADDPAALRARPAAEILEAQQALVRTFGRLGMPLSPVVDGATLPAPALDAIRGGLNAGVPLIAGTNRDEMTYFAMGNRKLSEGDDVTIRRSLERTVGGERLDELVDAYAKARADRGEDTSPFALWVAIESDRMFRLPALRMVEAQATAGGDAWGYLFDWESPAAGGFLKSCHALEIPFVLGNLDKPMMNVFAGEGEAAEALSRTMMDAWLAFAHTGSPPADWPRYTPSTRETMRFGPTVEVINAPMEPERLAWST